MKKEQEPTFIFSSSFHFLKSYVNKKGKLETYILHGLPSELENRKYQALHKEDSKHVNLTCLQTMWKIKEIRTVPNLTEEEGIRNVWRGDIHYREALLYTIKDKPDTGSMPGGHVC